MLTKIISGGQTGVDKAALDVAISHNLTHGEWCPKGRIDELGNIPDKYHLTEVQGDFLSDKDNYAARTRQNILDSDATLILVPSIPLPQAINDGTLLTIDELKILKKSYLMIDLSHSNIHFLINWLLKNEISILNIAGPREASFSGIYQLSVVFLNRLMKELGFGK